MIDLDKLFSRDGNINKRILVKLTDLEKEEIINATKFLQNNPKISYRIKALKLGITEHKKCICGNYLKYSLYKNIMFTNYCCMSCAKKNIKNNAGKKQKVTKNKKKNDYLKNVENGILLEREYVKNFLLTNIELFKNGGLQGKKLLCENPNITKTIIYYTKNHDKFNARIYEFLYGISGCCICGVDTYFLSLERGFCIHCEKHAKEIASISKGNNSVNKALEKLQTFENFNEYEILQIPTKINDPFVIKHLNCGNEFNINLKNGRTNRYILKCSCCENTTISKPEIEIHNILKSLNIYFIPQFKIDNKKIDIVIPDFNLAIEYHGMMDHSYGTSKYSRYNNIHNENPLVHYNRYLLCKNQGFKLLQIFEYEWTNKQKHKIWKSIINNHLNLNININGYDCEIRNINKNDAQIFMNNNHLNGYYESSIHLGLFYNNEMVSCLISNGYIQICNKIGYNVVGLLDVLTKNITGIFFDNKRYQLLNIEPQYFIYSNCFMFGKNKNKIEMCTNFMLNNDYRRFWDSGCNIYYIKKGKISSPFNIKT